MVEEKSKSWSFKDWNLKKFLFGRKKMIIAVVGGIAGWVITQDPALAGIVAGGSDLVYGLIEYYLKDYNKA